MDEEDGKKIENLISEYREMVDLYKDLGKSVVLILGNLIKKDECYAPIIISREKNIESLKKKLTKVNENGEIYFKEKNINTLNDIEDLAGVRAIFYLESEANKFINSIYEEFDSKNIVHKSKVEEKGYNATHLIVKLNKERLQLPEYSRYKDLRCEIQITTMLNHAWSEIEHKIIYKPEEGLKEFDKNIYKTLKEDFDKIMDEHIKEANQEFEAINHIYKELRAGKEIFDIDFLKNISKSSANNEIYSQLELLAKYSSKFSDKIPKDFEIIKVLEDIIIKTKNNKVEEEKTPFGNLPGKTHEDIVLKILEIVNHLRYSRFPDSFNFLTKIYPSSAKVVQNEIIRIIKNVSEYNYNLIKQNFLIQRNILDEILKWDAKEQIKNIEIIKTVGGELLEPSYRGITQTAENTFSLESGHLNPNENYKKLREETISYILNIYKNLDDIELKTELLKTLENASRTPMDSVYSDDYEGMVKENVDFLIKEYEKIVLDENSKVIAEPPIVKEIEKQLKWFNRRFKDKTDNCQRILTAIRSDEFYSIFRLLVSGELDYEAGEEGWRVARDEKEKRIHTLLDNINLQNLENFIETLNSIAKYSNYIEEYKFNPFKNLLIRIAEEKPEIAEKIIEKTYNDNNYIKPFIGSILCGFRRVNNIALWEKYVDLIISDNNIKNLALLLNSLQCIPQEKILEFITEKDIILLKEIINGDEKFSNFGNKLYEDVYFTFVMIQVLLFVYNKDKKNIEDLIISLIKKTKDKKYISSYFREMDFSLKQKTFSTDNWQNNSVDFLLETLVEMNNLDYEEQEILLEIGDKDYDKMMDVFIKRISRDYQKSGDRKNIFEERYEGIPFHFNSNLSEFIGKNEKFEGIINHWIDNTTAEKRVFNWELGRFINRVKGPIDDIIIRIIAGADDEKMLKILDLFEMTSVPNFELCFKIIEKTDNQKIWSKVIASMYRTGVVSGEYGIANAYKNKLKEIQKYREKYEKEDNQRAIKFIKRINQDLENDVVREERRADEDIKIRTLEFRSGL